MIQQANNENPKTWNAASAVALSKILPPEEEQDLVWDGISEIIASFEDSSMPIIKMLRVSLDVFIDDMFYDKSKNASQVVLKIVVPIPLLCCSGSTKMLIKNSSGESNPLSRRLIPTGSCSNSNT